MTSKNYLQKLLFKKLSRILDVLYRTQSYSRLVWLLLCSRRHCFREPFSFFYCDGVFSWSCFLPRRDEVVDWLSHISRVKNLSVVHSHMLRHFLHHFHCSMLVLCDGYLRYMMYVQVPSQHLHFLSDLNWDVHLRQNWRLFPALEFVLGQANFPPST